MSHLNIPTIAVLVGCLLSPPALLAGDAKRVRLTKEQELARDLDKQEKRLQGIREYAARCSGLSKEVEPLLTDALRLQQQARKTLASGQTYVAERLKSASKNLGEAAEHVANARLNLKWDDDDGQSETPDQDEHSEKDSARELPWCWAAAAR